MLRVFGKEKDKEDCIVLNENEKIKIMSSKTESDNLIITNKKGALISKKQKYKKYRNIVGTILIIISIVFITGCSNGTSENMDTKENDYEQNQSDTYKSNKENDLVEIERLIDDKKYDEAIAKIFASSYSHNFGYNCENKNYTIWDADYGTLYNYAYILKEGFTSEDISNKKFLMKTSNPGYERKHKDDILALGIRIFGNTDNWFEYVQDEQSKEYDIYNKTCITPKVGMKKEEVINGTWGRPTKINKTTTSNGTSEQWVYKGNKYIYFNEVGKVSAIQE